jgi:hypothetical protein
MAKSQSPINMLRRIELWASLTFFLILLCLSIAGACVGSEKAGAFFNSAPVIFFWILFLVLIIAGLFTFKRLLRKPGLLMIHLGCVLVLTGAMWSSDKGHLLQKKLLGIDKIPQGYIVIHEGTQKNHIEAEDPEEELGHLPFSIWLEDFWIDYYWKEGIVHVKNSEGQTWRMPARVGEELALPEPLRKIKILRTLTHLKVTDRITDRPRDRLNPALDIEIEWADGSIKSAYAFPPNMPHPMKIENFEFVYDPNEHIMPKDFYSDLVVLDYENKAQVRKVIEVNKPLHYNGYHFYQSSYGSDMRQTTRGSQRVWYTVLNVVSDSGLNVVFTGYILLCAGVFWHCWLRHISTYFTKRNTYGH